MHSSMIFDIHNQLVSLPTNYCKQVLPRGSSWIWIVAHFMRAVEDGFTVWFSSSSHEWCFIFCLTRLDSVLLSNLLDPVMVSQIMQSVALYRISQIALRGTPRMFALSWNESRTSNLCISRQSLKSVNLHFSRKLNMCDKVPFKVSTQHETQ
jgi:hypothetical protein